MNIEHEPATVTMEGISDETTGEGPVVDHPGSSSPIAEDDHTAVVDEPNATRDDGGEATAREIPAVDVACSEAPTAPLRTMVPSVHLSSEAKQAVKARWKAIADAPTVRTVARAAEAALARGKRNRTWKALRTLCAADRDDLARDAHQILRARDKAKVALADAIDQGLDICVDSVEGFNAERARSLFGRKNADWLRQEIVDALEDAWRFEGRSTPPKWWQPDPLELPSDKRLTAWDNILAGESFSVADAGALFGAEVASAAHDEVWGSLAVLLKNRHGLTLEQAIAQGQAQVCAAATPEDVPAPTVKGRPMAQRQKAHAEAA
jgi:hypothetical protein